MARLCIWAMCALFCIAADAGDQTIISHNVSQETLDDDPGYEASLLMLSLEKTRQEYGDFVIESLRDDMNFARRVEAMSSNRYANFIRAMPYRESLTRDRDLVFAPFPVFLGILGFRTCFIAQKIQPRLSAVRDVQDLLRFSHGQKKGWTDVAILEYNGFHVTEAANYLSLFRMVAANRFDLFCRGANEILVEYSFHNDIEGFGYDRSMAIYYPLPHFFYGHKSDQALIDRIAKGLQIGHEDGSIKQLWEKYYQSSVDFVGLKDRQIYYFENPHIKSLDSYYEQFIYNP